MDLLDRHPDALVTQVEPAELLAWLRTQRGLTPKHASRLDLCLFHWVALVLQRPGDPEGVQEILSLCELARDQLASTSGGAELAQRWSAFEDLLEARRRSLMARADQPPVKLRQQDQILARIDAEPSGRLRQSLLPEDLGLSAGRVSQILGVLEARGVIARERAGREGWVSRPKARSGEPPAQTPKPPSLGANVFGIRPHAA